MINTLKIYNELSKTMDSAAAQKITEIVGMVYEELQNAVTKVEFNELKDVVKDLAEAQKRTEVRLEELAEAQKRTEARVEELAEAQKRTEARVEELAEAQKRTEMELRSLTVSVKNLQKQVGGISHIIGYELEEKFYHFFPQVLKEDFGIDVQGDVERRFILYPDGRDDEINIYGEGTLDGREIRVIGESKAQIGKGDVRDFERLIKRVKEHLGKETIPILLCYSIHPLVEEFIRNEHPAIKVYKSHELRRRSR
jgi:hypothetical protein